MRFDGTTIVAVKRNGKTAVAGDGQITMGESVIFKGNAVKVRRIFNDKVVIGFAGTVSDAFSLSARFEELLDKETRLDVLTDRLIRCECVNTEELLRIIGSSIAVKRADELKAEYDKKREEYLSGINSGTL